MSPKTVQEWRGWSDIYQTPQGPSKRCASWATIATGLLDNSIDAQAFNIEVTIFEKEGDIRIVIEDDGLGMDEATLDEALRLGSETQREPGDLGKFGLAFVTASIGLSRPCRGFHKRTH